jgi:acyl-CoA thioester hydrolase
MSNKTIDLDMTESKMQYTTNIRVRYADTDKMGFVYNGKYLEYFEVGRAELMRSYGLPYLAFEKAGYFLPLIEAHVNYHNPSHYDDLLQIQAIYYPEISAKVKFNYNVFVDDKLIADGYTIHSFMKAETGKPTRPPRFFIDLLNNLGMV